MAVNKVVFDGEPIIDLTEDTVTEETLAEGVTAHNAAGEAIVGTYAASGSAYDGMSVLFNVVEGEVDFALVNSTEFVFADDWSLLFNLLVEHYANGFPVSVTMLGDYGQRDMRVEFGGTFLFMAGDLADIGDASFPVEIISLDSDNVHYQKIFSSEIRAMERVTTAESSDGIAYTANLDGITELSTGLRITIIPNVVSATTSPTLNVNGLGAKSIIMPIDGTSTGMTTNGAKLANWLTANKPVTIMYDGTYWRADIKAASADSLDGTVSIENGGTGADNAADALANLGITAGTTDLTAGTSALATGAIYLVYE